MDTPAFPPERVRALVDVASARGGRQVVYWMTANRRLRHNAALDRALDWARLLDRPLLVLEPLRVDYPWASDRFHRFVIDGMLDRRESLASAGIAYHAYVEPAVGAGRGLLAAHAADAAVVVADDHPGFFFPRMLAAAASQLSVRLEAVDSVGLLPMACAPKAPSRAFDFRRLLQRELPRHLAWAPRARPPAGGDRPPHPGLPAALTRRWPDLFEAWPSGEVDLDTLPIDHAVGAVAARGGEAAGRRRWRCFLRDGLSGYLERNRVPGSGSGLSPWLHFGMLSTHEMFADVARAENWSPRRLAPSASGAREGWWGMGPAAESFLDQFITWRELGHVFARHLPEHDRYESLPAWSRGTLEQHAHDAREEHYSLGQLEAADTADALWNAAQRQLRGEGVIDNHLRMLWGKKVLQWTASPREAWRVMLALNDRWALDGRDPNSYSGMGWVLGRFDRAWGPERPIFGKVRYMTSESARRKLKLDDYLARWGSTPSVSTRVGS